MDISSTLDAIKGGSTIISWLTDKGIFPERIHEKQLAQQHLIDGIKKLQLSPLEESALIWSSKKILREYCNQSEIITKAMELLSPNDDEEVSLPSDDWISKFLSEVRHVSDKEMQCIWSRILAGEIQHPGSVPIRLINILPELSSATAQAFHSMCRCIIHLSYVDTEDGPLEKDLILIDYHSNSNQSDFYRSIGVDLSSLLELDSIGLITYDDIHQFVAYGNSGEYKLSYHDYQLNIEKCPLTAFPVGNATFTDAGMHLQSIIGDIAPIETFPSVIERFLVANNFHKYKGKEDHYRDNMLRDYPIVHTKKDWIREKMILRCIDKSEYEVRQSYRAYMGSRKYRPQDT